MVINQEYFSLQLASNITLGLSLDEMGTVTQFETQNICTVPGVADFWYGVVNFKGSLLWILDSNRFFNLNLPDNKLSQKVTAVVVNNRQSANQKRVAMVTQQLKGIVTIEPSSCQPTSSQVSLPLRQCCSMIAEIEAETIHIIDSSALLGQLHQQSILVAN